MRMKSLDFAQMITAMVMVSLAPRLVCWIVRVMCQIVRVASWMVGVTWVVRSLAQMIRTTQRVGHPRCMVIVNRQTGRVMSRVVR